MITALVLSISLVFSTFVLHFIVLRWLSQGMAAIAMTPGVRLLVMILVALSAHLVEVGLYASAFAAGDGLLGLGSFGGASVNHPLDYLYFSLVSYTSLGLGDIFPTGHLHFLTGIEALNGLLLIAWSGSFIYIAMGRLWQWEACVEPSTRDKR